MKVLRNISAIPKHAPVYLYGASHGGELIRDALRRQGRCAIAAFVDRARTGELDGVPILRSDEFLRTVDRDVPVIITSMHYDEINLLLIRHGFTRILNASPLIDAMIKPKQSFKNMPPVQRSHMLVRYVVRVAATIVVVSLAIMMVLIVKSD